MASRTLDKGDKAVVIELADDARAFAETVQARIRAGYVPRAQPIAKLVTAMGRLSWNHILKAFAPSEVPAVLALAMKDRRLHADLLRTIVTPELIALFVRKADGQQSYQQEDVLKALAFAAKKPDAKRIIQRELPKLEVGDDGLAKSLAKLAARLGAPPKATPVVPAKPAGNEADLLAAIAAEPGSDEPRRVYADWLLEHGIGFGEYIVAVLAGGDAGSLERKHAKAWLAPIRPFLRSWSFDRGLLSLVETDAQLFVQAADAIADRAPRATLRLVGLKARTVAALARAPLGRFGLVNLSSQRLDDAGAAALASSASIAGLAELYLTYNQIGDGGARAFAASPHVKSLHTLALENSLSSATVFATAAGLTALLQSRNLPRLRSLSLNCRGDGLGEAIASCKLQLDTLRLVGPTLTEAELERVRAARPDLELDVG